MLHENLNAAKHQSTSSLIWTNHWKILKNPQNGIFKGIFSSVPTDGAQMKLTLMKWKFGQCWNSNISNSSCPDPEHGNFYHSVAEPVRDVLKLQIQGYVQANSASRQQWRKWIDAAELEWEILYNKWYLLDCQETYTGNPKRLLLRHGQYQNFRVNGT